MTTIDRTFAGAMVPIAKAAIGRNPIAELKARLRISNLEDPLPTVRF